MFKMLDGVLFTLTANESHTFHIPFCLSELSLAGGFSDCAYQCCAPLSLSGGLGFLEDFFLYLFFLFLKLVYVCLLGK